MSSAVAAVKSEQKEKEKSKGPENEIRVTRQTLIRTYLAYIATLFQAKQDTIVIRGTGYVIPKANALASLTRRRFKGLHQLTEISTIDMPTQARDSKDAKNPKDSKDSKESKESKEPKEPKDSEPEMRKVALLTITLSTKELDKTHPGYAAPLPDSQVTEYVPAVRTQGPNMAGPRRGMRGRRGRGYGRRFNDWGGYYDAYYPAYYTGGR